MTARTRRVLLATLPPVLATLPSTVLLVAAGDRLPDPVAVHFGWNGVADGFAGRGAAAAFPLVLGVFLAVVAGGIAHGLDRPTTATGGPDEGRWLVGGSWGLSAFLGTVLFACAAAGLDRAEAVGTVLPAWTLPAALAAGFVAGVVGHRLAPPTPRTSAAPRPAAPLAVGPTEQVSWSRSVVSRAVLAGGAALGLAGLAAAAFGGPAVVALVGLGAGALLAALSTAQVTVDRRGLVVALGPLGRPRLRVPADDVASAAAADVSSMRFGGWGYRIVPGGAGVILRSGRALVVTRRSGRRFTVTVDDADTAARLLAGVAGASRC